MIANVLLCKWSNGWHVVTDATSIAARGRREATLGLGAAQSISEVERVAGQQLVIFADPRTEIGVDLANVDDTDTPFVAFGVADTVMVPDVAGRPATRERVQAITVTVNDETGAVTYAPELRDVLLDDRERFAETLAKMANGTLGGNSSVGQPTNMGSLSTPKDCCPGTVPTDGGEGG